MYSRGEGSAEAWSRDLTCKRILTLTEISCWVLDSRRGLEVDTLLGNGLPRRYISWSLWCGDWSTSSLLLPLHCLSLSLLSYPLPTRLSPLRSFLCFPCHIFDSRHLWHDKQRIARMVAAEDTIFAPLFWGACPFRCSRPGSDDLLYRLRFVDLVRCVSSSSSSPTWLHFHNHEFNASFHITIPTPWPRFPTSTSNSVSGA